MTYTLVENMDQVFSHALVRQIGAGVTTATGETEASFESPSLPH
jgi:hypothetical protein